MRPWKFFSARELLTDAFLQVAFKYFINVRFGEAKAMGIEKFNKEVSQVLPDVDAICLQYADSTELCRMSAKNN